MPAIAVRMAVSSGFAGGVGFVTGKEGAWGVFSSGDGIWAHLGIESGSATFVGTVSRALVGTGAGDGADDRQIGVVGMESASVSISVGASETSLPGGGVVRSRTVTFFFLVLFGRVTFSGEGLAAFGVRIARLSERDSPSSLASWMAVLHLFLSC